MKKIFLFLALFLSMQISFGSLPGTDNGSIEPKKETPVTFFKENGKVDHKKLRAYVASIKGGKLTVKEKVGLKLFGKKIATAHQNAGAAAGKSQLVALLLCILVGGLGVHRFYLGYTWQGIVQLLTGGGCGIWALIDLIRIITGSLTPKDGDYDTTL